MWSFLTFDTFVSSHVLIFMYYIMAVIMPIFLWSMRGVILKKVKFLGDIDNGIKSFYSNMKTINKIALIFIFLMMFLCMELCLRMMFEMMIGYFDMHEYLQKIAT